MIGVKHVIIAVATIKNKDPTRRRYNLYMRMRVVVYALWWAALMAATLAFFSETRLARRALQESTLATGVGDGEVWIRTRTRLFAPFGVRFCDV